MNLRELRGVRLRDDFRATAQAGRAATADIPQTKEKRPAKSLACVDGSGGFAVGHVERARGKRPDLLFVEKGNSIPRANERKRLAREP